MVQDKTIKEAIKRLSKAAPEAMIILFGSRARGEAGERSDLDLLVVEPEVKARRMEMVRLSDVLRPLKIPVDILVTSRKNFEEWSKIPGTVIYRAATEGKVLYDPEKAD